MVFPVIGGDGKPTGYEIDNSLRFNDDDSPNVSNNPNAGSGSDGSRTQFSISMWVKRSRVSGTQQFLTSAVATNTFYGTIKFNGDNKIQVNLINSGSDQDEIVTDAVYRDVSAWYHLFFVFDKTQAALSNGIKLYVNGVLQTWGTTTYAQNQGYHFFRPGKTHYIGNYNGQEGYFDGHMAEIHFVDGQLKAHTDFGETDDNGVWIPKEYDGTHGTYGFYLEFKQTGTSENSSGIGADTSGNDEHFAVANLAATDVTEDTPTNNFATLVPALNMTLSEGNTKAVTTRQSNWDGVHSSIGVTSGKWYFEVKASRTEDNFRVIGGVAGNPENFTILFNGQGGSGDPLSTFSNTYPFYGKGVWLEHWYDEDYNDSSTASTQSSGDILQFALDMDNYKLWVGVNGQFKDNSNNNVSYSDVASGNSATVTIASGAYTGKTFFPAIALRDDQDADDNVAEINFGNPSFSISSGNTDGKYGNFEYAVPSGYYSLCTKNLAEYG
jgi:hypothetical protein